MNPIKIKNWCKKNSISYCNRYDFKEILNGNAEICECYFNEVTCDSYSLIIILKSHNPNRFYKVNFISICHGLDKMIFVYEYIDGKFNLIIESHHIKYEDYLKVEKFLNKNTPYIFAQFSEETFKECFTDLSRVDYCEKPVEGESYTYKGLDISYDSKEDKYTYFLNGHTYKRSTLSDAKESIEEYQNDLFFGKLEVC